MPPGRGAHDWSLDAMTAHEAEYLADSRTAAYASEFLEILNGAALDPDTVAVVANDTLKWGDQQ
ncbi:hypothetical protein [Microbacterium sp. GXF0217]